MNFETRLVLNLYRVNLESAFHLNALLRGHHLRWVKVSHDSFEASISDLLAWVGRMLAAQEHKEDSALSNDPAWQPGQRQMQAFQQFLEDAIENQLAWIVTLQVLLTDWQVSAATVAVKSSEPTPALSLYPWLPLKQDKMDVRQCTRACFQS